VYWSNDFYEDLVGDITVMECFQDENWWTHTVDISFQRHSYLNGGFQFSIS